VVDYAMPGMNGVEASVAPRARRPMLRVVLATGFAGHGELPQGLPVLRKPFSSQDLARALDAALTGTDLAAYGPGRTRAPTR
jgi:CheY-like chemotaxis protein